MSAIYLHIPFCKSRCNYCDFFSSERKDLRDKYVDALCNELSVRKDYLQNQPVETVYFGGGTPSQLAAEHFCKIFSHLQSVARFHPAEITIETNPDDLSEDYIRALRKLPFNRISLGIQSFDDGELQMLGRRHNAETAIKAVKRLQTFGYDNISIDLMYGLPNQTENRWQQTLKTALSLGVQHISAYHLTYEKDTALDKHLQKGIVSQVDEEMSVNLFEILIETLTDAGFEHYEISNFALKNFRSKHNYSYWNGSYYLGVGAAAHSYDGQSRQWNVYSLNDYIKHYQTVNNGVYFADSETIDAKTAYKDFIITRLRTKDGIDINNLLAQFGIERRDYCLRQAHKFIENKTLILSENILKLTRRGIFVSDGIIADLM
jgi:oxygen-independent coproporphyrinogen-3 oxidase